MTPHDERGDQRLRVEIHGLNDDKTTTLPISPEALTMVRPRYRPGGLAYPDVLNILFAAAIIARERFRKTGGEAARRADVADTCIEAAIMRSVKAATTDG